MIVSCSTPESKLENRRVVSRDLKLVFELWVKLMCGGKGGATGPANQVSESPSFLSLSLSRCVNSRGQRNVSKNIPLDHEQCRNPANFEARDFPTLRGPSKMIGRGL